MNARGKQLTDFEAFKADLVKYITEPGNPESDYYAEKIQRDKRLMPRHLAFSINMDNDWTNFFWSYSQKKEMPEDQPVEEGAVDQWFMNFLIRYFFNLFIIQNALSFDQLRKKELYGLYGEEGDDRKVNYQSLDFYKDVLAKPGIIAGMEQVLDCLAARYEMFIRNEAKAPWRDGHFSDEWDFFGPQINQSQRVIFLAITFFIEKNVTAQDELDLTQFKRWMRVVRNIAENANIDSAETMTGIMRLVNELSPYSGDIYAFLAGDKSLNSNAAKEQIFEERKKAKLILEDRTGRFEREIIDAENHRFFRGQIYFLLYMSEGSIEQFVKYRDRAKEVFVKDIEKTPCSFHRVLAALIYKNPIDDRDYYAQGLGYERLDFFKDENAIRSGMLRHNDEDFYYRLVKMLLDTASSAVEFDGIIKSIPFDEKKGQTYLIHSSSCFNYCQQKLIALKNKGEEIYLLKHSRMSHHHAELRTYYLYKEWMKEAHKKEAFLPFTNCNYFEPANGSESPCAYLDGFKYHGFPYALDILYSNTSYELRFFSRDPGEKASHFLEEINTRAALGMEIKTKEKNYDRNQLFSSGYKTMAEVKKRIMAICDSLKKT
jgi:hypothetical protein